MATSSAGAFLGLTVAVHVGLLAPLDTWVRSAFRPDDVWGPLQWRADRVVEGLRPAVVAGAVLVVVIVVSTARRSVRPVVLAGLVGGSAGLLALTTKVLLARPDPHAGGMLSYPSGHTVTLVVCLGVIVFLVRPQTRWGWIIPAAAGLLMAAGLLVQAAHWGTDVLGGGLLATAVLTATRAVGLDRWAAGGTLRGR